MAALKHTVSDDARAHILNGDAAGGGHRFGARKGKTEFPKDWSDQDIIDAIESVANDGRSMSKPAGYNGKKLTGTRNSVTIEVIINWAGRIITGYPV